MKSPNSKRSKKAQSFYLIVPFSYGTNLFTFKKKSNWNIIDHLLLRTIADNEFTIDKLSAYSGIRRQILVQMLLPFLKLNWIEIIQEPKSISVRITERGKFIAKASELPSIKKEFYTYRDFLVNLTNGQYLGLCNHSFITTYNESDINTLVNSWDNKRYINIKNIPHPYILDTQELSCAVTQPNEELISVSPPLDRSLSVNRYLIFNAKINKNNEIDIHFYENYLNPTSSNDYCSIFGYSFKEYLSTEIKKRLIESQRNNESIKETYQYVGDGSSENLANPPKNYKISEQHVSLILGGNEHLQKFLDAIRECKNYLIIHSTFIRPSRINLYLSELLDAVNRGVKVIILWGKDDFDSPDIREKELRNFEEITSQFKKLYCDYNGRIILHEIQTGSHAKYLLWDTENNHCSLIGSCNWFFSEFNRYEASVFIQDNDFSKEMIQISASLTTGAKLINNYLGSELLDLAQSIKPSSNQDNEKNINVSLLLKGHHLRYIHEAKKAEHRVTLLSDKISPNLHRSIWDSLSTCRVRVSAFYSTVDKEIFDHKQVQKFSNSIDNDKIALKLHSPPSGNHSHAKVLAWDKNHIVITSLNWMSSDSSGNYKNNDLYHELGIYLEADKIEQKFYSNFFNNLNHA